jgi:choline dehydrogenase
MTERGSWDYVVVGAGAAGCVLAERLSRGRRYSVLVLEAGGRDWSPLHHVPAGKLFTLGNPRYDWRYRTEPDPSRFNRTEVWPRGKVVGGSTTINGLFYVRGNRSDFDRWAALGNRGWSYADVLPHFRALEAYGGHGDPDFRGAAGALRISDMPAPHMLSERFVRAAEELGLGRARDYNGAVQDGASLAQTTIHRGFRQSAAKAFLHPAVREGRVTLISGASVQRIEIEAGAATGVTFARSGRVRSVRARREVLVAAGAVGSPHLLMLSGIGPADQLREAKLELVRDLPGVGQNLQEHAGVWIVQGVKPGIRTANMDYNPLGVVRQGLRYLTTRQGAIGTPTAQCVAFLRTSPAEASPDVQVHFMPMGYRIDKSAIEVLKTPAMMAVPNVNRPDSRGELRLDPEHPQGPPRLYPRLLESPRDVERMIAACRLIRRIFAAPAFSEVVAEELFPGPAVQSDGEWERVLRERVGPVFHIAGTCKMGSDPSAVVDASLKVHGVARLRVADSSVMPIITSGNTNAPTLMIASRAAEIILDEAEGVTGG